METQTSNSHMHIFTYYFLFSQLAHTSLSASSSASVTSMRDSCSVRTDDEASVQHVVDILLVEAWIKHCTNLSAPGFSMIDNRLYYFVQIFAAGCSINWEEQNRMQHLTGWFPSFHTSLLGFLFYFVHLSLVSDQLTSCACVDCDHLSPAWSAPPVHRSHPSLDEVMSSPSSP